MNAVYKLKWMIILRAIQMYKIEYTLPDFKDLTEELINEIWDNLDEINDCAIQDAKEEVRSGEVETDIVCDYSRHYESKSVAAKAPDGTWIGWTYWYGGGKYGEPEAMEWISDAYDLDCVEEEKIVTVRTFSKIVLT